MFFKKKEINQDITVSERSSLNRDDFAAENVKQTEQTLTIEGADSNRIKMDNMYGFGHR